MGRSHRPCTMELMECRRYFSISLTSRILPISDDAKAADPRLNHFFCYQIYAAVGAGDQWTELHLDLSRVQGEVYKPPAHDSRFAQPSLWTQYPYLKYDTFICGPNWSVPTIDGRGMPAGPPGTEVFSSSDLNVSYHPSSPMPISSGNQMIIVGRITLSDDWIGPINSEIISAKSRWPGDPSSREEPWGDSASGNVFKDLNADGVRQPNEPGVQDVTWYIDYNNDGRLDGEDYPYYKTDVGGFYWAGLDEPGVNYKIRIIVPYGYRQTKPSNNYGQNASVSLTNPYVTHRDFGITQVSPVARIKGTVFSDTDGDGTRDAGEGPLFGATVYIDENHNGVFDDPFEPYRYTDFNGEFVFDALPAGTYVLGARPITGYLTTSARLQTVTITTGQTRSLSFALQNVSFGGGQITGTVFADNDGNGVRSYNTEPGRAGWTVFLDLDNDGVLDSGEPRALTDDFGVFRFFTKPVSGTYVVRVLKQTGYRTTTSSSYTVTISPTRWANALSFGEQKVA